MSLASIFQDIADAIRSKTGKSESIYPVDMASEIEGIESGGGYKLEKMPSGAVSSFNDGTDLPLNKLKVSIEPVQDLHGYDAPWSGGAGKNKSPVNSGEIKSGDFVIFSTPLPSGNYAISFRATRTGSTSRQAQFIVYDENGTAYNSYGFDITTSRVERTLNATNGISRIYFYSIGGSWGESQNFTLTLTDFQVEDGNTATAYEPYSNICPISGWDECNVSVSGKNLFDIHIDKDTAYTNIILDKPLDQTFTVSAVNNNVAVSEIVWRIGFVYKNNEVYYVGDNGYQRSFPQTIIATESNPIVKIQYRGTAITSGSYDVQVELGSQPTTYEPYNRQTYTIDLDGTRYGGTLDVVSGVLTVDKGYIASYNGETLPSTWISDRDVYAEGSTPTTEAEVCYELATPQTIQLTPTAVRSLIELNNVWADTGDIMDGEYFKGAGTQPTS